MIKVFIIVGMVCVQSFQCWTFQPEKKIKYETKQECLMEGNKLGKEMFDRMNKKEIPARVSVYCYEMELEKWQAT